MQVKITPEQRAAAIKVLIPFVVGIILGAWGMHTWLDSNLREKLAELQGKLHRTEQQLAEEKDKTPVAISGDKVSTTEIKTVPVEVPGEVTRIVDKDGKQFVVVAGKEYQLQQNSSAPAVTLGKDGAVSITKETTSKLDITDMFNAAVAAERKAAVMQYEKDNPDKHLGIGGVISNHGAAPEISYQNKLNKHVDYEVGIFYGKDLKGGSLKFEF